MTLPAGILHRLGPYRIAGVGERHLRVYLPRAGPRRRARRLLVLFDGQNVFDDGPAFGHVGWRVHEIAERLRSRAPLVVAVEHGGRARLDDLSPHATARSRGHFPALLGWLADTLVPDAIARLGVDPTPGAAVIAGSSMGGLAALHAWLARPDRFGAAVCLSPSLWFDAGRTVDALAAARPPPAARLYLDVGAREGPAMVACAQRAAAAAAHLGDRLRFRLDPRGRHDERAWRRRFPAALRFALAMSP